MSSQSEIRRNGKFREPFLPADWANMSEISDFLSRESLRPVPVIPTRVNLHDNMKRSQNIVQLIIKC
jgi:hypothetical protein